ncbi:hypothetical protein GCM10012319_68480 [Comamonas sp. KCTC 72670]|nr:hypothetical protein GCM10012319_68480 [Comamonas sp. KCTC 72670]
MHARLSITCLQANDTDRRARGPNEQEQGHPQQSHMSPTASLPNEAPIKLAATADGNSGYEKRQQATDS